MAELADARDTTFRRITRGMPTKGTEKGKRELPRMQNFKRENAGVEDGTVENLASKTPSGRKSVSERYVRNPTRARNGHRTSPCGDDGDGWALMDARGEGISVQREEHTHIACQRDQETRKTRAVKGGPSDRVWCQAR